MRLAFRVIGGAFVALASAFLESTHAADITVDLADPRLPIVVVSGELLQGDHKLFVARTVSLDNALVVFESGGGNLIAGLEIGKAIRLKEFHTYVPDKTMCASACALAWIGGTERYLARTSAVGFHAAYRTEGGAVTESGTGNAMVGAYLNSLGLPSRAIAYMTIAAPDSMQWLTAADAEKLGIDVTLLNEPSTIVTPTPSAPQAQPPRQLSAEERRFWAELEREIPNWSEVNNDPKFHAWLLSVDELTGITRQIFLEQAQKSLDAKRVIAFFKAYEALNKPAPTLDVPPKPDPPPTPKSQVHIAQSLSATVQFTAPREWVAIRSHIMASPNVLDVSISKLIPNGAIVMLVFNSTFEELQTNMQTSGLSLSRYGSGWIVQ